MPSPALVSLQQNPRADRWIAFDASTGRCTVRTGKVELGQGIVTAVAQLAAEGLGLDPREIDVVAGDTAAGPDEGWTAGSLSTGQSGQALFAVCTLAREALAECRARDAAATYWSCSAEVLERSTAAIRQLLRDGQQLPQPPLHGRWVGHPLPRQGWAARLQGGCFIQDLRFDGLVHARTLRPSHPLARIAGADLEGLTRLAGVEHVLHDGSFVAIAGQDEAALVRVFPSARQQLRWKTEPLPTVEEALGPAEPVETSPGDRTAIVTIERGFLTSASIGTSTGIALWHEQGTVRLEVWSHSQGVFALRAQLAQAHGLEPAAVVVRHVPHAGCYGHNGADDAAYEASIVARRLPGRPVRLVWTREEELAWSPMGSAMRVQVAADLDATGRIDRWQVRVTSGTHANRPGWADGVRFVSAGLLAEPLAAGGLSDIPQEMGWGGLRNAWPYYVPTIANVRHVLRPMAVRTSSLRALGAHVNVPAIEATMDELAAQAGEDPLEFRLRHLDDERARAVLRRAASMAGWENRRQRESSLGIAFARYKNQAAYMAVVVALDLSEDVRVRQVWAAVDAGLVVNPDGVRNQVEGGIVQAMSWTLHEEVRWDAAGVSTADWETYAIAGFRDVPRIELELMDPGTSEPLGVGEVACGPTAAAIGNALAAGLGVRLTRMPFTRERIFSALA